MHSAYGLGAFCERSWCVLAQHTKAVGVSPAIAIGPRPNPCNSDAPPEQDVCSDPEYVSIWKRSMKKWVFHRVRMVNGNSETKAHLTSVTQAEAKAMLSTAFNIFDRWNLSDNEARILLGSPSPRFFQRWKSKGLVRVPMDTLKRLEDILGVHKALRFMFTDPVRGYDWVKKPNARFDNKSALHVMLKGLPSSLSEVRSYLDIEREA